MSGGKTKVDELREALDRKKSNGGTKPAEKVRKSAKANIRPAPRDEKSDADDMASDVSEDEILSRAELQDRLNKAEQQALINREEYLRTLAEFENYRRRTDREKSAAIEFANESLLRELVVILDHLDEALAQIPASDELSAGAKAFVEGVELTLRQFLAVLAKFGFEEINAEKGVQFDPSLHEATGQVDDEASESNTIFKRLRRGYTLRGRVLRAAMVLVVS